MDAKKLLAAVTISQMAGVIGSFFTASSIGGWYSELNKPSFNPPSWLFGPVWITLYTLMGVAAYLVWQKGFGKRKVKIALTFFAVQLFLNALWSIIFFGLRNPELAFAEIIILLATVAATTLKFRKISKTAAALMLPYILWTMFAAVLNFYIAVLN